MTSKSDIEESPGRRLFADHAELIDRVIGAAGRKNGLTGAEAEDFSQEARLELLKDDSARLRAWSGGCPMQAFLAAVVSNLLRDYRIREWGKYRPSAKAKKWAPWGPLLERLIVINGATIDEAIETAIRNHHVTISRAELREIALDLPPRLSRRAQGDEAFGDPPAPEQADDRAFGHHRALVYDTAKAALDQALANLEPEDRLMLKLLIIDGLSVAEVARALGVVQRQLYDRRDRLLRRLRETLSADGLEAADVLEALGSDPPENPDHGPSS